MVCKERIVVTNAPIDMPDAMQNVNCMLNLAGITKQN